MSSTPSPQQSTRFIKPSKPVKQLSRLHLDLLGVLLAWHRRRVVALEELLSPRGMGQPQPGAPGGPIGPTHKRSGAGTTTGITQRWRHITRSCRTTPAMNSPKPSKRYTPKRSVTALWQKWQTIDPWDVRFNQTGTTACVRRPPGLNAFEQCCRELEPEI